MNGSFISNNSTLTHNVSSGVFSFSYLIILFLFDCTGSLLLLGLSLVTVSRGYPLVAVHGLLLAVASLVAERRL